jgi:hypothetical protein
MLAGDDELLGRESTQNPPFVDSDFSAQLGEIVIVGPPAVRTMGGDEGRHGDLLLSGERVADLAQEWLTPGNVLRASDALRGYAIRYAQDAAPLLRQRVPVCFSSLNSVAGR